MASGPALTFPANSLLLTPLPPPWIPHHCPSISDRCTYFHMPEVSGGGGELKSTLLKKHPNENVPIERLRCSYAVDQLPRVIDHDIRPAHGTLLSASKLPVFLLRTCLQNVF